MTELAVPADAGQTKPTRRWCRLMRRAGNRRRRRPYTANVQYPIPNAQCRNWILDIGHSAVRRALPPVHRPGCHPDVVLTETIRRSIRGEYQRSSLTREARVKDER